VIREWRIGKDAEGSTRSLLWRFHRSICLEGLRKPLITSVKLAVSGSTFETGTTPIQSRSVNHSITTFGKSHSNNNTASETWRAISTKICNDKRTSSAGLIIRKLSGVTSYSKYLRFLTYSFLRAIAFKKIPYLIFQDSWIDKRTGTETSPLQNPRTWGSCMMMILYIYIYISECGVCLYVQN
jgi:hypothetical protein